MSANLLVTGGAGFIGSNFVHYWRQTYPDQHVVVLDALTYAGNPQNLATLTDSEAFTLVQGNICDADLVERLVRTHRVDTIVHFAAESHVDRSISSPDAFVQTNVVGTHNLLKAARSAWLSADDPPAAPLFLHVSTDEVYGSLSRESPAFHEDMPYAPNSPYSATKAGSDHLVRSYHRTYGLPVITTNCSNNYGPYQFPEKLIPLMIANALDGKALPVYGDGLNIRDWIFVQDHCRGIDLALQSGKPGETYNLGGQNEQANIDIVKDVCAEFDRRFACDPTLAQRFPKSPAAQGKETATLITYVKDRPGHDRRYAVDSTKAGRELGYQPQDTWRGGLEKTVAWYVDHEPWWRHVMDGSYREWIDEQYVKR